MNKNKSHHPHDIFFRKSMEQTSVAVDLLKSYLPKGILSKMDLSTLIQQKESFIEKDIGRGEVDCLYQVELISSENKKNNKSQSIYKNTEIGYVYILIEQQTKPERFMGLRLVKYMISIIEYHRKKHKDDNYLPLIYPLVIHTGLGSYNAPTNILDLFRDRDLARMMMSQFFQLLDVSTIEDVEMKKNLYAGTMMYIYKHRAGKAIADIIELIKDNLSIIMKEIGIEYPSVMLEYLINTSEADEMQTKKLINIFIELASEEKDKEKIMTIADRLMEKGEQRGIEKGMLQGMQVTAINMLNKGFDLDTINEITGIDKDKLLQMRAKNQ